ncbi:MAG: hypothetical protein ACI9R7_001742, partial [Lysobacterales bacterium]
AIANCFGLHRPEIGRAPVTIFSGRQQVHPCRLVRIIPDAYALKNNFPQLS